MYIHRCRIAGRRLSRFCCGKYIVRIFGSAPCSAVAFWSYKCRLGSQLCNNMETNWPERIQCYMDCRRNSRLSSVFQFGVCVCLLLVFAHYLLVELNIFRLLVGSWCCVFFLLKVVLAFPHCSLVCGGVESLSREESGVESWRRIRFEDSEVGRGARAGRRRHCQTTDATGNCALKFWMCVRRGVCVKRHLVGYCMCIRGKLIFPGGYQRIIDIFLNKNVMHPMYNPFLKKTHPVSMSHSWNSAKLIVMARRIWYTSSTSRIALCVAV